MRNIIEYIKGLPKVTKIVMAVGILGLIMIIVVAVIAKNVSVVKETPLVDVTNLAEVSTVPEGYRNVIEQSLGNIIKSNANTSGLVFSEATVREGTYNETVDGDIVMARFIVDIPELEYSFNVSVVWPKGSSAKKPEDPDVTITCPYYSDVIYKNKKCIAESPEQQIGVYLPHYGRISTGQRFGVSASQYNDKFYLLVEIKSCGDQSVMDAAVDATKKWIKSIYMDPNDFVFTTNDICEV